VIHTRRQRAAHRHAFPRSAPRPGARGGLTLIELVVAIGLMAVMLSMMAIIFGRAQGAFREARASVEIHQMVRAVFDTMRQDLAGATLIRHSGDGSTIIPGQFVGTDLEKSCPKCGSALVADERASGTVKHGCRNPDCEKYCNWDDDTNSSFLPWTTAEVNRSRYHEGLKHEAEDGDVLEFTTTADQVVAVNDLQNPRVYLVRYFLVRDGWEATREIRGTEYSIKTHQLRKFVQPVYDRLYPKSGDDGYVSQYRYPNKYAYPYKGRTLTAPTSPRNEGEALGFWIVSMNFRYYDPAGHGRTRSVWAEDESDPDDPLYGQWPPRDAPWPTRIPALVECTLVIRDHLRNKEFTFVERFAMPAAEGDQQ